MSEGTEGGNTASVGLAVGAGEAKGVTVGSAEGPERDVVSGAKGAYNMAPARRKAKANARIADNSILLLGKLKSQTFPAGYEK